MDGRPEGEQGWLRRASNSTFGALRSIVSSVPPSSPQQAMEPALVSQSGSPGLSTDPSRRSNQEGAQEGPSNSGQTQRTGNKPRQRLPTQSHSSTKARSGGHTSQVRRQQPDPRSWTGPLSSDSSPGFPNGVYFASEFMLGAGMVILQPSTEKVVIVYDEKDKYWFLPKGRKDTGESLEQAALREAFEESGYQAEFLPLHVPTNAPEPPGQRSRYLTRNTEPIYMSTHLWHGRRMRQANETFGGEYLTFWFVGMIPEDAQWHPDTGMHNEKGYRAHVVDYSTAMENLGGLQSVDGIVVHKAYELWRDSAHYDKLVQEVLVKQQNDPSADSSQVQEQQDGKEGQAGGNDE